MKTYTLVMQIEADDDVNPARIREELYDAGGDVPFGFEITSITEPADRADEDAKRRSEQFEANRLYALHAPLRDAMARQEGAMRANREAPDQVDTPREATGGSARIITTKKGDAGSITIGNPDSGQAVEIASWTSEETERYNRTGETPLASLHRENLARQWNSADDRAAEK